MLLFSSFFHPPVDIIQGQLIQDFIRTATRGGEPFNRNCIALSCQARVIKNDSLGDALAEFEMIYPEAIWPVG